MSEVWRGGAERKVMFAADVPRGVIVSHFNRKTRQNSRIEEFHAGKWSTVWNDKEETIFGVSHKSGHVCAAECGASFLRYDHKSGRVKRLAKIPAGYKYNIHCVPWRGTVAVGAVGDKKRAAVIDAFTGTIMWEPPLSGLICGMAVDENDGLWLAIGGTTGERGVCLNNGRSWRDFAAASIAIAWGDVIAGGMDDGAIWRLYEFGWRRWIDLKTSKVNRLIYDPTSSLLYAAGSNPDTVVAITHDGRVEVVAQLSTEKPVRSGEQFDAGVDIGREGTLLVWHSTSRGTGVYRAQRA